MFDQLRQNTWSLSLGNKCAEKYCWFYKNEYGEYGGVYEWIYDNIEEDRWLEGNMMVAGHPSTKTWKKFVNDILLKEVI